MGDLNAELDAIVRQCAQRAVNDEQERRAAFNALREADAEQAEWLKQIAAEFGKPTAIEIKIPGRPTYRRGEFK